MWVEMEIEPGYLSPLYAESPVYSCPDGRVDFGGKYFDEDKRCGWISLPDPNDLDYVLGLFGLKVKTYGSDKDHCRPFDLLAPIPPSEFLRYTQLWYTPTECYIGFEYGRLIRKCP